MAEIKERQFNLNLAPVFLVQRLKSPWTVIVHGLFLRWPVPVGEWVFHQHKVSEDMSEVSAASQIATFMRQQTATAAKSGRANVQPEHIAGKMGLSTQHSGGGSSSVQFDNTGQIVPDATHAKKGSGAASFADLLN